MIKFCKQHYQELFSLNGTDFNGYDLEEYGEELCEGCTGLRFNRKGECIDNNCPKHGVSDFIHFYMEK
jgi:hypothetical protein